MKKKEEARVVRDATNDMTNGRGMKTKKDRKDALRNLDSKGTYGLYSDKQIKKAKELLQASGFTIELMPESLILEMCALESLREKLAEVSEKLTAKCEEFKIDESEEKLNSFVESLFDDYEEEEAVAEEEAEQDIDNAIDGSGDLEVDPNYDPDAVNNALGLSKLESQEEEKEEPKRPSLTERLLSRKAPEGEESEVVVEGLSKKGLLSSLMK